MSLLRISFISALLTISCLGTIAWADEGAVSDNVVQLIKDNGEYKTAWAIMFKGEWSIPGWIVNLEGTGQPAAETTIDGEKYIAGVMRNPADTTGWFLVVLYTPDHKKCWALEATIPPGLRETPNPEKFAALRYYGNPSDAVKKALKTEMDKEVAAHPIIVAVKAPPKEVAPVTPPPTTPTPAVPATPMTPQDDEKAQKFRGELHAKKGKEMMGVNNFRQAESEYKEAAKYDPDNIAYLEGYANAANKANDCKESIEAFGRLLKLDGAHHPEGHELIAECLFKMRQYDQAVDEYTKAVPFAKSKAEIWNKIAEIRIGQARHTDAMSAYRSAIKAAPGDGKAYKLLGSMLWNAGNKSEALTVYKNGASSAPKDGDLLAAYAYALMSNSQWQEAAKEYKAAAMVKGSTKEIEEGYKSAMDHIAYDEQQSKLKAAKDDKNKKKH
jgi:tetratricopeptide (TPR) repeat protein